MKAAATIIFIAAIFPCITYGEARNLCPILPENSGYEWSYKEGPDFDLCYAVSVKDKSNIFGIYYGYHPGFHVEGALVVGKGNIGGKPVVWYEMVSESGKQGKQTIVRLNESTSYSAHIWVPASSEDQAFPILENIRFNP